MPSRTRTRRAAAGVHTVKIPHQRGRGAEQLIVVVPPRQSMARRAGGRLALAAWEHRQALAPTFAAVLAFNLAALLHALAWWSGLILAPAALAPVVALAIVQRRHPVRGAALTWRIGLTAASTFTAAWLALAATFGPLFGPHARPLCIVWLLALIGAQTTWPLVRRTH